MVGTPRPNDDRYNAEQEMEGVCVGEERHGPPFLVILNTLFINLMRKDVVCSKGVSMY